MEQLKKSFIHSIRVSLTSDDRIVVLKEESRERYLPVWIGKLETSSLTLVLEKTAIARPMTHDLMAQMMESLGASLLRVEIVALVEDTYMANLVMRKGEQVQVLDCRPSDALALAVRLDAPIFVAQSILDQVGIEPELDRKEAEPAEQSPDISVFEDFLDTLQRPDPKKDEPKNEPPFGE